MIARPAHLNPYEFAVVAALRAQQLLAGCTPRLGGEHSATTMAQMEVAEGCVVRSEIDVTAAPRASGWQR
jgi:DNA-directed RNA polymerase subunit K/omega